MGAACIVRAGFGWNENASRSISVFHGPSEVRDRITLTNDHNKKYLCETDEPGVRRYAS